MRSDDLALAAMAEIGAMRRLLVHMIALRLMDEPAPHATLDMIGGILAATPTAPAAAGGRLDPAVSDLLSALTDERTASLVDDVRARLAALTG
jgi:hypothetical protein